MKSMDIDDKPYIILSAAMTIDGKIATMMGDSELSDELDFKEVHKLRTEVDAIMVGKGTILKDDPKLRIKYHAHDGYYRIVIDSNLSIPIDSKVITFEPDIYPTIICTIENVSEEKVKQFENKNIKIIRSGAEKQVNIENLLSLLKNEGINSILLEGGGNLNWSFMKNDLIDEIRLTIAPWMIGGKDAISLVEGSGFERMSESPRYELTNVTHRDNYVTLYYKRGNQ